MASQGASDRQGPTTTEPPTFPDLPTLKKAEELPDEVLDLVSINKQLVDYWRNSPYHIRENTSSSELLRFGSRYAAMENDAEAQKELIIAEAGPPYFPVEMLQVHLVRPSRNVGRIGGPNNTKKALKEMEQKEHESKGADDKQKQKSQDEGDEEEFLPAEEDDFGGDDYAHDYYADEDLEDHLEEGNDDGVF